MRIFSGLSGILIFYGRFNIIPDKTQRVPALGNVDSFCRVQEPEDLPRNY